MPNTRHTLEDVSASRWREYRPSAGMLAQATPDCTVVGLSSSCCVQVVSGTASTAAPATLLSSPVNAARKKNTKKPEAKKAVAKKRVVQHLIDEDAKALFQRSLPKEWVLREYRPDYGIDFDVEVFQKLEDGGETLGEHVFIQLKGTQKIKRTKLSLYRRLAVESYPLSEDRADLVGKLDVISFSLEASELVTIQRMGAALPVLLVVADVKESECYFVCLNDYIDKILVPRHGANYAARARTIHIPLSNRLSNDGVGLIAFRWYAKRAKLFAAFQKFVYQQGELAYAYNGEALRSRTRHFSQKLLRYDFWANTEMWAIIPHYGNALATYLRSGRPHLHVIDESAVAKVAGVGEDAMVDMMNELLENEIRDLWRCLALLPRIYEDLCREWYMPTSLGYMTSYRSG